MASKTKLTMMVASTVYNFEDQIKQICAVLSGFGYTVWNSYIGTIPQTPRQSNLEICVNAASRCDVFLGFIRPFYGSGKVGARSITHEECLEAIKQKKPRWFMAHHDVTLSRQLLKPYMFTRKGERTRFQLKKNPVLDDLRVIDLYNDAIQNDVPVDERKDHWVQEFLSIEDVLPYLESQFKDVDRVRLACKGKMKP